MRLGQTLALFALILALLTGMSFLGYRYLTLASEYRARNMIHLSLVHDAMDILAANPVIRPEAARQIKVLAERADAQAHWCIDNLSMVERKGFELLGASAALDLCHQGIEESHKMTALLDQLLQEDAIHQSGADSPFARNLQLLASVERLERLSHAFHPHVNMIEDRLVRIVEGGTAVISLCLALFFVGLSRQMIRSWQTQAQQTRDLNRMTQRVAAAMGASGDGFAIFDDENRLVTCNDTYRELSHAHPEEVKPGMSLGEILVGAVHAGHYALHGATPEDFAASYNLRIESRDFRAETQLELAGDRHIIARVNETDFGDKVVTRSEITQLVRNERQQREAAEALKEAKDRIEQQSLRDPLTKLANRRHLDQELARRLSHETVTLVRIDLDRFKKINDILGHEAGDFVLCHVADVLRKHTKSGDLPARVGGDEYVILCQAGTTLRQAEVLAKRVLAEVLQPVSWGNKRCNFGASFGVACGEAGAMSASELLSNADAALYRAKASGRATVEVFTSEMRQEAQAERALADQLQEALERGEIVPFYHTQHDARTWHLAGLEVLARWDHPSLGVLPPSRFLGLAKQLGLEAEIDGQIFEAAVQQVTALRDMDIHVPRVAFNVSAPRIMEPGFLDTVQSRIPKNRDQFAFEILESISCEEGDDALIFCIDTLKDMGFQIDMDDFGSGHASINGVLNIEPHAIKIDRNIIFPLGKSERAERMVASVVDLAHTLDVKIIAEGVDTLDKAKLLRQIGCDTLQGFYFSKPRSFADLKLNLLGVDQDRSVI
ncbi:putative bifunctional diguanylate cyclase/phosphodiesterase [Epibacterium sp. Ofav1-8]|uniref:putative bifunctional diguanylate cyclase/phosphodiesterase n=1 Tax=Epibacterium sp. Ofav1-8 TaxID=2917735 RepID=UPI001EF47F5F|nr:EAL domain-containing protein [Epibacterium sp. Ofav1-8]MCG7624427.1 EAL domain-containing protein [Epibacterium sp. Ofav1-8]